MCLGSPAAQAEQQLQTRQPPCELLGPAAGGHIEGQLAAAGAAAVANCQFAVLPAVLLCCFRGT
jgi:hypothetical protein